MNSKPRNYKSTLLTELIESTSPEELEKTESKMRLAIKIADAIREQGYSKTEFARKIKKNNSEISKWLSGTHNFTHDTLILLEQELNINLINSEPTKDYQIPEGVEWEATIIVKNEFNLLNIFNFEKPQHLNTFSFATAQ